jgi:hypothetical protein
MKLIRDPCNKRRVRDTGASTLRFFIFCLTICNLIYIYIYISLFFRGGALVPFHSKDYTEATLKVLDGKFVSDEEIKEITDRTGSALARFTTDVS